MSTAKIFTIIEKTVSAETLSDKFRDELIGELLRYKSANPDNINDLYALMNFISSVCTGCMKSLENDLMYRIDKTKDDLTSFSQVIEIRKKITWLFEQDPKYFLELQGKRNQEIKLSRLQEKLLSECETALSEGRTPPVGYTSEREIHVVPFDHKRG